MAARFAQVKEEPAQRAGDTEQSALPPTLRPLLSVTHRKRKARKFLNRLQFGAGDDFVDT